MRRRHNIVRLYSVVAHCFVSLAQAERGLFGEAGAAADACARIADEAGAPFYRALAAWALGHAHLTHGDLEHAVAVLERALADCDRAEIRAIRPWIASDLGLSHLLADRVAEAVTILEQAVNEASSWQLLSGQAIRLANLGQAYLQAGRRDDAKRAARAAIKQATEHGERAFRSRAVWVQGAVALEADDTAAAAEHFGQVLSMATALDMRPLVARCHLALAITHRAAREEEAARRELDVASTMFREMAMTYWIERAERERRLLD